MAAQLCFLSFLVNKIHRKFIDMFKQDSEYFDSSDHSPGKLITRLSTDASNIRAAIDQR